MSVGMEGFLNTTASVDQEMLSSLHKIIISVKLPLNTFSTSYFMVSMYRLSGVLSTVMGREVWAEWSKK